MRIKSGETEIQINLLVLFLPPALLIAGFMKEYAVAFFSILLHECSHIAVAHIFGIKTVCVKITPVGFSAVLHDKDCSRWTFILIYSAGPLANLIICGAALAAGYIFHGIDPYLKLLFISNLFLALFNLFPVIPLDGGRILMEFLAGRIGLLAAGRKMRVIALVVSIFILLVGVYQLTVSAINVSLICIGLYILFLLRTGRMESALMNIRQIIYRRSRLMKKGLYPARDLVVIKNTMLGEVIKNMDFDRFHMVYVLDEHLHLLKVFTETEIMDALTEGGENMSFEQLLEISSRDIRQNPVEGRSNKGNIDI